MAAVSFVARTDVGRKRKANEDFFAVDEARQIFVVADGLGGHAAGRTASETASFRFCQAMREMGDLAPLEAVRRAFHDAHAAVLERSLNEPELAGMGTTLVTLWVRERTVVLQEISQEEDTPDDYIHDLFPGGYWEGHALGRPVCGTAEVVERLQFEFLW